jgi:hypothetical protein
MKDLYNHIQISIAENAAYWEMIAFIYFPMVSRFIN